MVNQNPYGNPFNASPVFIQPNRPQQQQQQQQQPNPMQALGIANQFGAFGGGGAAAGTGAGAAGASGAAGAGAGAAGAGAGAAGASGGAAGSGATSALASNPFGWIVAAALAQNVAHNKGISSWQSAFKGQSGRDAGEHFLDQWGVDDDSAWRDVAGFAGWGEGGGIFNPSYLNKKIFGS